MRVAFITVGDTQRLTGGYLYHARVFALLRARSIQLDEIVASGASLDEQLAQAAAFGTRFDPQRYDLVVVDALARAVCAPWLDQWRAVRPLVAMVHELPSVANANLDPDPLEAALLRADLLIAVSGHGRALLEARGVLPTRLRVVSPGCDRLPAEALPVAIDSSSGQLRVLCVAQWIRRKGIHTLVEAWVRSPRPGAMLELIGENQADPAYAALVHAAIAQASPTSAIVVRGAVGDAALAEAYQHAALFALPSIYEGYGMAYAEALLAGLPVIACSVGPVPELLGAGGWLVPPDHPVALAGALDALLTDADLRARYGQAARDRAAHLPTWAETAARFEYVLVEALNRLGQPQEH